MNDHFALLGQPRRPWLDREVLKEAFHRRSAELHPDVPTTGDAARFAELNAAFTVLRDPAARLRHLLELTVSDSVIGHAPPPAELGEFFMRFGALKQRINALSAKHAAAGSPLSRALLAGEEAALRHEVTTIRHDLSSALAVAERELRSLDENWGEAGIGDLAKLYQRFAYLGRWLEQAAEAALRWEK